MHLKKSRNVAPRRLCVVPFVSLLSRLQWIDILRVFGARDSINRSGSSEDRADSLYMVLALRDDDECSDTSLEKERTAQK